jgi:hypothetical protein
VALRATNATKIVKQAAFHVTGANNIHRGDGTACFTKLDKGCRPHARNFVFRVLQPRFPPSEGTYPVMRITAS